MANGPYGFTLFIPHNGGNPPTLPTQTITDLLGWGGAAAGVWLRYQLLWKSIEQVQGQYIWTNLDDAVAKCNAAGINIWLPISSAPSFYLTISSVDGSTVAAGTGDLPSASATATFASVVASRYNGQNGHGTIQILQIGNEEYDSFGGNTTARNNQAKWLVPVVKATYPAIKAVYPTCQVGVCSVRKTDRTALAHVQAWVSNLFTYQGGIGSTITGDNTFFLDFHYYRGGSSAGPDPTTQDADTPSVATELAAIQNVAASFGFHPQVICAETGWDIYDDGTCQDPTSYYTPAQQSQYLIAMIDALRTGGGAKCFVYTVNSRATVSTFTGCATATQKSSETKSIAQKISGVYTYEPAYTAIQAYQVQHPFWSGIPTGNQNQGSDTFATAGRGTPNAWSPASDTENWTQTSGTSTLSINGSKGQMTGTTTVNILLLGTKKFYDSELVCHMSHSNVNDASSIVARANGAVSYYYAKYANGVLSLNIFNAGSTTQLASTTFTETAGVLYWMRFKVQGFGTWTPNLFAKIWADGATEPGDWQISASDSTITSPGQFGVRGKGTAAASVLTFDNFFSGDPQAQLPTPANNVTGDIPYGVTAGVSATPSTPGILAQQALTDIVAWGSGAWLRYQLQWQSIEQTQGLYFWSVLDDAVARANIAGVNLCLAIEGAPSFRLTVRASDGTTVAAGSGDLPGATDVATFAQIVALRYNGTQGFGTIQAFQIGGEDWDSFSPRDAQAQWLVPVVKAAYPVIRAAAPSAYIGICAVKRTPTATLTHVTNWMTNLWTYQSGIEPTITGDAKFFLDFHYYRDGVTAGPDPTTSDADTPSIATELTTIQTIASSFGALPQIWCAETGWPTYDDGTCQAPSLYVTAALQSTYIQSVLDALRTGGGRKCFVYTLDPKATVNALAGCPNATVFSSSPKSIVQTISGVYTHLQAYSDITTYTGSHPIWSPPPPGLQNQASDTFATAGRGTPNAWSPASDSESWSQAAGTSTMSVASNQGVLTGSTSVNTMFLGTRKFYDSELVARMSHSNVNDANSLLARATTSATYYYAKYTNGALTLNKTIAGTTTQLASFAFTEVAGTLYWVRFKCQGFGTWGSNNNLFAKIWADGTAEPAGWQVSTADSSITGPGQIGIRVKATTTGTTQTVDTFFSGDPAAKLPAPTSTIAGDLPYGTTYAVPNNSGAPAIIAGQAITDIAAWGNGAWLRYQLQWQSIEQTQGLYLWSVLDDAVARCNIAGLNLCFVIQNAPGFRLTVAAADGGAGTDLPGATDVTTFAQLVATRYNGSNGFGTIQAIQIGSEDWDSLSPRDLQAQWLVPVVKAAYPVIRAAHPTCYIGVSAVKRTTTAALTHITNWVTNLWNYQNGIGSTVAGDARFFIDLHYYRDGAAAGQDPTTSDADTPSIATTLTTIQRIPTNVPGYRPLIWCSEIGWQTYDDGTCQAVTAYVTEAQRSTYIQDCFDALRTGGGAKCFVFTLDPTATVSALAACATATTKSSAPKSIVQTISSVYTHLQAYTDIGTYKTNFPVWVATITVQPPSGNQNQGSDTFVTGGRGSPNAWSPASDTENWAQAAGTSTMSIVSSQGKLTGTTGVNVMLLGTKKFYDSEVACRMSHGSLLDSNALIARATSSTTYYYARYSNGTLTLNLSNNGTLTQLASFGFTEVAATLYWVRLKVQGFGTWTPNLFAKIWADGTSEPTNWQVQASDSTITAPGQFGVRGQGNATGSVLTYDTFFSGDPQTQLPTPTSAITGDLPYGISYAVPTNGGAPALLSAQALSDLNALGTGQQWLRYQLQWKSIEQVQGTYYWAVLDDAVARANAAGINMCFSIQSPPTFRLTISATTGGVGTDLPSAADVTTFAQLVATRYNGQNGFGIIQAFQIGNTGWDTFSPRDIQSQWLVPIINSALPAIRAAHPSCYIGVAAVQLTPTLGLAHIQNWMNNLWTYQGGVGPSLALDPKFFLDFHYYRDSATAGLDPTVQDANTPSIATVVTTILAIANSYGYSPQLWCTEFGWSLYDDGTCINPPVSVSQALQSTYTQAMLDALRTGGAKKGFIFTLDPTATVSALAACSVATLQSTAPKSIVQTIASVYTYMQVYNDLLTYEGNHPAWVQARPLPTNPTPNLIARGRSGTVTAVGRKV